jgi:hypothetical protein
MGAYGMLSNNAAKYIQQGAKDAFKSPYDVVTGGGDQSAANYTPNYTTMINGVPVQGYAAPGTAYANSLGIGSQDGSAALDAAQAGNYYYFNKAADKYAQTSSNAFRRRGFTQGSGVAQQGLQEGLSDLTNQFTAQNAQNSLSYWEIIQRQKQDALARANQLSDQNRQGKGNIWSTVLGMLPFVL